MMPILLNFEKIVDGSTFNNFIIVILGSFVVFGRMLETNLINKMVCFGVDIVGIF
jgi:hypothetical protein